MKKVIKFSIALISICFFILILIGQNLFSHKQLSTRDLNKVSDCNFIYKNNQILNAVKYKTVILSNKSNKKIKYLNIPSANFTIITNEVKKINFSYYFIIYYFDNNSIKPKFKNFYSPINLILLKTYLESIRMIC